MFQVIASFLPMSFSFEPASIVCFPILNSWQSSCVKLRISCSTMEFPIINQHLLRSDADSRPAHKYAMRNWVPAKDATHCPLPKALPQQSQNSCLKWGPVGVLREKVGSALSWALSLGDSRFLAWPRIASKNFMSGNKRSQSCHSNYFNHDWCTQ